MKSPIRKTALQKWRHPDPVRRRFLIGAVTLPTCLAASPYPSAVTSDVRKQDGARLTDNGIRERMSDNLCRCGAYVNIVAAIHDAAGRRS